MAEQALPSPGAPLVNPDRTPTVVWFQRLSAMWKAFNALTTTQADDATSLQASIAALQVSLAAVQADVTTMQGSPTAKAWGLVTVAAGAPTLTAGYNIASITDGGAGIFSPQFTTEMASANYCVVPGLNYETPTSQRALEVTVTARLTTGFTVNVAMEAVVAGGNVALIDNVSFAFTVFA